MTFKQCINCDKREGECQCNPGTFIECLEKNELQETKKQSKKKSTKQVKKVKGRIGKFYVESILLDEQPYFLCNLNDKIELADEIIHDDITYKPLDADECGYFPYNFSKTEIDSLTNDLKDITREKLLDKIKEQTDYFVDICERDKNLVTCDLLLSYCQEWVDTLHYPFIVGETESGKSTILYLFKWLAYRTLLGEGIPYANLYRFLGKDEEATGTICEDEAQDLYKDFKKIKLYKSSYARGSVQPRMVGSDTNLHQVFFKTYCLKVFAGEKVPENKGFKERLAIIHMTEGLPKGNIKRLDDEQKNCLLRLRNLLLFWKVWAINCGITKPESGLEKRDQELWEDFQNVVHGTKYYEPCKQVTEYYINQRHQFIWQSLEAKLFRLLIKRIDNNCSMVLQSFWDWLTIEDAQDELTGYKDKESFFLYDFGRKLTRNSLSKIFDEKFQGKRFQTYITHDDKKQQVTKYVFDKEILQRLGKKYNVAIPLDSPVLSGGSGESSQLDNYVDHVDDSKGE